MVARSRRLELLVSACLIVACAGGPQRPAPPDPEPAATATPPAPSPVPSAGLPDCTSCFEDGASARADDPARALQLFERGCQREEAAACHAAGDMLSRGEGAPENDGRAISLQVRACELGHGQACSAIGIPMVRSETRAPEGRALLARGCELEHAASCIYLAAAHQQALGGAVDRAAAARAFGRACELGSARGCAHQGIAFQQGQGVAADPAKARALYERACEGGEPMGCGNLAIALREGVGGPVDEERSVKTFERACTLGGANGCLGFGMAFLLGRGGLESDPQRAVELFEIACEGGEPIGCENRDKVTARLAERAAQPEPRWTTKIGSLNIGSGGQSATFEDVRSTCSAIPLTLAFGAAAGDVRGCLSESAKRRVSLAVEAGRLLSSSAEPDDAEGRCVVAALGRAPLGDLTCAFEATVSR